MNILIADPDHEFVTILAYWLRSHGHHPLSANDANQALKIWRERSPELTLVDLALPGANGPDFCRRLREIGVGLILVLTDPTHEEEEVRALEAGADGYLPKPVSMRQVQAHIAALGRRIQPLTGAVGNRQFHIGPTSINLERYEVSRNGRRFRLTPTEGRLLQLLISNIGQTLSTDTIIQRIWGYEGHESNLLKTHIHHLRQKIEPDPEHPRFLLTLPTVGYLLNLQEQERQEDMPPDLDQSLRSGILFPGARSA